jgi:hypothetical protein
MVEITSIIAECMVANIMDKLSGDTRTSINSAVKAVKARLADRQVDFAAVSPDGKIILVEVKRYVSPSPRPSKRLSSDELLARLWSTWDTADSSLAEDASQSAYREAVITRNVATVESPRRLPTYATRPFLPQPCCTSGLPSSASVGVGEAASTVRVLPFVSSATSAASFTVLALAFSDRRQFQDYKAGLLQLVGALLACLCRMFAILLAAIAHLTTAPAFALVMLSSVRHYGHRGEPDHLLLPLALTQAQQQGTVRLAA